MPGLVDIRPERRWFLYRTERKYRFGKCRRTSESSAMRGMAADLPYRREQKRKLDVVPVARAQQGTAQTRFSCAQSPARPHPGHRYPFAGSLWRGLLSKSMEDDLSPCCRSFRTSRSTTNNLRAHKPLVLNIHDEALVT